MRITILHNTQEKTNVEENNKQNKEQNTMSQRKESEGKQHTGRAHWRKGASKKGRNSFCGNILECTDAAPQTGESQDTHRRTRRKKMTRKKPRSRSNQQRTDTLQINIIIV
jgi:hypothetical protein